MNELASCSVKDIVNIKRGYAFRSEDYRAEGTPILRVTNISENGQIDDKYIFLNADVVDQYENYFVDDGDVLLVMVGATTGKLGFVGSSNVPALLNQNVWNLKPREKIDKGYLRYKCSEIIDGYLAVAQGSARDFLKQGDFEKYQVCIHENLEEQQKIANILSTVDKLIEKTQTLIDKYTAIKQGMMADLLTRGIDLSPGPDGTPASNPNYGQLRPSFDIAPELYQQTELGWVPKEWEVVELSQVVDQNRPIVYGILMPGTGVDDGVPVIKVRDIKGGVVLEDGLLITSHKIDQQYRRSKVKPGDLLYTIRGTVGRLAKVTESLDGANITQDTARVAIYKGDEDFYMAYLDSHNCRVFAEINTLGVAVQGINLGALRQMPVSSPPILEQQFIKEKSKGIENLIAKEVLYVKELQKQKKGLMQDLLTGKVKVV